MTTLTTVFGMLPLLVLPGEGSELYRGLAAIVIGGMLANVIFTFILVPTLMQLFESQVLQTNTSNQDMATQMNTVNADQSA